MSETFEIVSFDFQTMLAHLTQTQAKSWKEASGPSTRCGLDYYYVHLDGREAYINVDQEFVTISVDGEALFSGVPTEDENLKDCVRSSK
jgi:hypothetical protein